jgi:hydroxyacylglutathione hydrolase
MGGAEIDFARDQPVAGNLEVRWIHGSRSARDNTDPKIQVHAYDEHTYILRQNKAVHYEGPFMYLFCGNDRALLLDTGATVDSARFPLPLFQYLISERAGAADEPY